MWDSFQHQGSRMLSNTFNEARKNKKRPNWVPHNVWDNLLTQRNDPNFKKLQEQNKRNRAANPGASLHCGGSITMSEHVYKYEKQTGNKVEFHEIIKNMNQRKQKDKVGEWVDPYAAEKYEAFTKEKKRFSSSHSSTDGSGGASIPSDAQLWKQVVGEKKGRVYGMGSQAHNMWSDVQHAGGPSASIGHPQIEQRMGRIENTLDTLIQLQSLVLMNQMAMQQSPSIPPAQWMQPSIPPSQMIPGQMPHTQMPSNYPAVLSSLGQRPPLQYMWSQPPFSGLWPQQHPGDTSQAQAQPQPQAPAPSQNPHNSNVVLDDADLEEDEDLGEFP